jgi:pimeloyl-ACP methyl ester carboxylesterase
MRFFLTVLLAVWPLMAQTEDTSQPHPAGKLVDIGGRRLHLNCIGQGTPVVILVHGTGAFSFDWGLVQPKVGSFARVCSYDRAGHAWSDPAPALQTYREMSDDLHTLMHNTGEIGPFVLVGHSGGGELVRVFALTYPNDVAGIVLVETGHPDSLSIINGSLVRRGAQNLSDLPSRVGSGSSTSQPSAVPTRIEPPYDNLPAEDQRFRLWALSHGRVPASSAQSEVESVQQLRAAHERGGALLGDKPLIVISRASGGYRPIRGIVSKEQADLLEHERVEHNQDLLTLSRNSKAIVADQSGHDVHLDQPALIIESIRVIRNAIRNHSQIR